MEHVLCYTHQSKYLYHGFPGRTRLSINISIVLNNFSPVPIFILKRQQVRFVGCLHSIISAYHCSSLAVV